MPSECLRRLSTFGRWPMPSDACSGIRNFASKAAAAYLERSAECVNDEVVCTSCGVKYSGWESESPATVHRVVSPYCPALNATDTSDSLQHQMEIALATLQQQENPYTKYLPNRIQQQLQTAECESLEAGCRTPEQPPRPDSSGAASRARRVLFPENDPDGQHVQQQAGNSSPQNGATLSPPVPRVLEQAPITHPIRTKFGGYDNLFASKRLQTFPTPVNKKYEMWAEEGFVFRERQQDVVCVFCGTVLVLNGHQPNVIHKKACPSCPYVMGFDVGNISQQQEKDISFKYFTQPAAKKQQFDLAFKYPEHEKEEDRQGTFQGWPKMLTRKFPPAVMAYAGFFYSGCSDKVMCYCCGVELYDWSEDADVWKTHAKVSPTCLHVINQKGQEFIAQSATTEVLVEVKRPNNSSDGCVTSSGGVVGEEPGSPNLDLTAIKAALACGYTLPQIQHAIVKFFCQTSRYPNEAILKASLKAADENYITICRQQQVVKQKVTQLQQKDTQLQQTYTVIQQKDTQLQQTYTVIQQKDTQLQQKDTQLQRVIQEKQQTVQTVQTVQQQLAQKDEQLSEAVTQLNHQATQLSEAEHQLQLQGDQIRTLMGQVQQLRADQDHRNPAPGPDGDGAPNLRAENEQLHHSMTCKICMSDRPRMIFLPCGHLVSCAECTSHLPDRRCPVCRQDISEVLPAFVA